ncbi:hypothetical protein CK203_039154 [Vitis vinifera]|uniref:Uncharacterized protein n=1 Tax=Vitis vinifera TaxID=29760 RepID=A0A438IFL8_VITVI|nr:hypothetical protein CK203_039154 [Vitis vinifera]
MNRVVIPLEYLITDSENLSSRNYLQAYLPNVSVRKNSGLRENSLTCKAEAKRLTTSCVNGGSGINANKGDVIFEETGFVCLRNVASESPDILMLCVGIFREGFTQHQPAPPVISIAKNWTASHLYTMVTKDDEYCAYLIISPESRTMVLEAVELLDENDFALSVAMDLAARINLLKHLPPTKTWVNDGAMYLSVGVPTVCICNGAASITGHYFNGCPSPWNGIVGNGVNVARVFLDHQSLSTDADLSVSLNLTILMKPHREKASSRIVDRRQYPIIDGRTWMGSNSILVNKLSPCPDFIDAYFGCLKAKLLSIPVLPLDLLIIIEVTVMYLIQNREYRDGIDNLLGMEKEYVILLAAGASRIENQDSIDAVITKWATVIVWLYCSDKVAESSWYGDVILDAGCQNIAPNLVSVQPPSTIVHPSETRQDLTWKGLSAATDLLVRAKEGRTTALMTAEIEACKDDRPRRYLFIRKSRKSRCGCCQYNIENKGQRVLNEPSQISLEGTSEKFGSEDLLIDIHDGYDEVEYSKVDVNRSPSLHSTDQDPRGSSTTSLIPCSDQGCGLRAESSNAGCPRGLKPVSSDDNGDEPAVDVHSNTESLHHDLRSMREAEGFHRGTYKQENSETVCLEASVFKALFHFIYWDPLPSIEEFFYFERLSTAQQIAIIAVRHQTPPAAEESCANRMTLLDWHPSSDHRRPKASASTLSNIKISWQNGGYFGSVNHAKNAFDTSPLYSNPELRKMMQNPRISLLANFTSEDKSINNNEQRGAYMFKENGPKKSDMEIPEIRENS